MRITKPAPAFKATRNEALQIIQKHNTFDYMFFPKLLIAADARFWVPVR